jgi:hypothetical protein
MGLPQCYSSATCRGTGESIPHFSLQTNVHFWRIGNAPECATLGALPSKRSRHLNGRFPNSADQKRSGKNPPKVRRHEQGREHWKRPSCIAG